MTLIINLQMDKMYICRRLKLIKGTQIVICEEKNKDRETDTATATCRL